MLTKTEQKLKALDSFKDWSNYMLLTTVAAIGWVASSKEATGAVSGASCAGKVVICLLAASAVLAVLTLALVPLVAEEINENSPSIYEVRPKFRWFWGFGDAKERWVNLKWICWPQHLLFMAGVITYAGAAAF